MVEHYAGVYHHYAGGYHHYAGVYHHYAGVYHGGYHHYADGTVPGPIIVQAVITPDYYWVRE